VVVTVAAWAQQRSADTTRLQVGSLHRLGGGSVSRGPSPRWEGQVATGLSSAESCVSPRPTPMPLYPAAYRGIAPRWVDSRRQAAGAYRMPMHRIMRATSRRPIIWRPIPHSGRRAPAATTPSWMRCRLRGASQDNPAIGDPEDTYRVSGLNPPDERPADGPVRGAVRGACGKRLKLGYSTCHDCGDTRGL
jgi:hypothetical protein